MKVILLEDVKSVGKKDEEGKRRVCKECAVCKKTGS